MDYTKFKNMEVSKLCFGGLTMGPLHANLSPEEGGELVDYAFSKGVNFIDTAEIYQTYKHINKAKCKDKLIITSKTYAYEREMAIKSVEQARKELDRDTIDIFLLHEQESEHTLRGHKDALDYLLDCRANGIIKAVGLSTHHIAGVLAAANTPEIEVVHPIFNKNGIGIVDGGIEEMQSALKLASENGKFVYSMKPLGGGHLIKDAMECFDFVLSNPFIHSTAVGMQSVEEIDANVAIFEGKSADADVLDRLSRKTRKLLIEDYCEVCGECVKICGQSALEIKNEQLFVNKEKCVLCGYCGRACPNFALKII